MQSVLAAATTPGGGWTGQNIAAIAIAGTALLQYPVLWLFRRWFRQGEVDVFRAGKMEVSFGFGGGPVIVLHGTFRAVHREVFISHIDLTVTREHDGATHGFDWAAFGSQQVQDPVYELPVGFLIDVKQPYRYVIAFSDVDTRERMVEMLQPVRKEWLELLGERGGVSSEEERQRLYSDEFSTKQAHVIAFRELARMCYWTAGAYTVEMRLTSSRPNRTATRRWRFELTEADAETLVLNTPKIIPDSLMVNLGRIGVVP